MYPEISIGPVTLQTFGLMFGLGFIAAGVVIARRFGEVGKPPDWAYEMAFSALIGGLVGSRVYYLVEHWDECVAEVGEGTARVWGLYLAVSRVGFERDEVELHQVLATRNHDDGRSDFPMRPDW